MIPAVLYDLKDYRIPNSLILLGYLMGVISACRGGGLGLTEFAFGALLPIAALILLQRAGILGGGDVKLLSVTGGFLGPERGMECVIYAFLFGAVISLIVFIRNSNFKDRICYFLKYIHTVIRTGIWTPYYQIARDGYDSTIHFSIAVLFAALFVLWENM
ncbi:MAG: prepilin peptidase [Lachnospiraceae bacterium]|nr:prepilin peptidase [Lachnospiraceae bacterium]